MKRKLVFLFLLGLAALLAWYGYQHWRPSAAVRGTDAHGQKDATILYYHCPMHPDYKSDRPGNCPICGMRLEPVYADKKPEGEKKGALITPEQQQLYGVSVGEARFEAVSELLRTVGIVQYDETRTTRIHPKIEGWIEQVFADFTGRLVRAGDPLVSIYSPEMFATQQEYLLALRARRVLEASSVAAIADHGASLAEAARRRLELWDFSPDQLREVTSSGRPQRTVTLYAPATGFIVERNAYPGQRVTPDTGLYMLVDLSRVWVMAEIPEADGGSVRVGQPATVRLAGRAGPVWKARVDYIQPSVDQATRTLKARLELDNSNFELKPGAYVDIELRTNRAAGLFVPSDAVLDSGLTKRVFVDRGEGRFEPREVETGREIAGKIEILSGLTPGERIVTSGVFLVDSESRLRPLGAESTTYDHPAH